MKQGTYTIACVWYSSQTAQERAPAKKPPPCLHHKCPPPHPNVAACKERFPSPKTWSIGNSQRKSACQKGQTLTWVTPQGFYFVRPAVENLEYNQLLRPLQTVHLPPSPPHVKQKHSFLRWFPFILGIPRFCHIFPCDLLPQRNATFLLASL